jgi:hypothetical protein
MAEAQTRPVQMKNPEQSLISPSGPLNLHLPVRVKTGLDPEIVMADSDQTDLRNKQDEVQNDTDEGPKKSEQPEQESERADTRIKDALIGSNAIDRLG